MRIHHYFILITHRHILFNHLYMQEDDDNYQKSTDLRWPVVNNRKLIQKIANDHKRTNEKIIYLKEEKDDDKSVAFIFPLLEAIHLNIMNLFWQQIVEIYQQEDLEANNIKYFAVCQAGQQTKQALSSFQKLYNLEQYERFLSRQCNITTEKSNLPQYLWIINVKSMAKTIEANLNDYKITYSYLDGNFLIEKTYSKQNELNFVIQSIETDKYSQKRQIVHISRFLLIQLRQDEVKLQRIYSIIEMQLNTKNIYRFFHSDSRIQFILQLDSIIDMLGIKSILKVQKIPYKHISEVQYSIRRPNFMLLSQRNHFKEHFDLQKINKSFRNSDILQLEMLLNTNEQQFIKQIDFMLDNWSIYRHLYEEDMEELQDLLMAYINQEKRQPQYEQEGKLTDFYSCSKRYTAISHQASTILPKIRSINEYEGNIQVLLKQISKEKHNTTFANFIHNTRLMAARKGTVILGQKEIPLTQHIAKQPQYQSRSRRAARWQHFFSFVGNSHYLQFRDFEQKEKLIRQQYMKEIDNKVLLDLNCLGCCRFFYDGQNIRNSEINQTPFKIIQSASNLEEYSDEIKQSMQYLMSHSGGIIFFDCALRHRDVITKGIFINYQKQGQIVGLLKQYFRQQLSKDRDGTIQQQITVSFVPVFKNPLKHKKRSHITNDEAETKFVTRVKIDRALNKPIYLDNNQIQHQQQLRQLEFLGQKISCFHPWPCDQPLLLQAKRKKKKKPPSKQQPKPLKQRYDYMSLMCAKKQDRQQFQKDIKGKNFGEIAVLPGSENFKCAVHLVILYHNERLQNIRHFFKQKYMNKEDNNPKIVSFTEVNSMICLPDRFKKKALNLNDFNDMINLQMFKPLFEGEEVVYWQFRNNFEGKKGQKQQFFFYLKDKEKCIYLYFVLNNYSQKAKFKLPEDWQQITYHDMKSRFKLIFNSKKGGKGQEQLKKQLYQMFQMKKMGQTSRNFKKQ